MLIPAAYRGQRRTDRQKRTTRSARSTYASVDERSLCACPHARYALMPTQRAVLLLRGFHDRDDEQPYDGAEQQRDGARQHCGDVHSIRVSFSPA